MIQERSRKRQRSLSEQSSVKVEIGVQTSDSGRSPQPVLLSNRVEKRQKHGSVLSSTSHPATQDGVPM